MNHLHLHSNGPMSTEKYVDLLSHTSSGETFKPEQTTMSIIAYTIIRKLERCGSVFPFPVSDIIEKCVFPREILSPESSGAHNLVDHQHSDTGAGIHLPPGNHSNVVNSLQHSQSESALSNITIATAGSYEVTLTRSPAAYRKGISANAQSLRQRGIPTVELLHAVDKLIQDFEKMSMGCLNQDIVQLDINDPAAELLDPQSVLVRQKSTFYHILHRLFSPDAPVSWGRVISLLAFTSELVLRDVRRHRPDSVSHYLHWATTFICIDNKRVIQWVLEQPLQWEGLVEFAARKTNWEEELLSVMKTAFAVSLTGLALYGAMKVLKNML